MAVCSICHFGPKDGVSVYRPGDSKKWACFKHLRFLTSKLMTPAALRTLHALHDGTIDDTADDVTPKLH